MRYRKGMIALSETRDYPLLRRVLYSSFVTPAQLYEFMKLDYCVSSRNAFDNRLRRLLTHDLLVRHEIPTMNRGVVYSISRAGASEWLYPLPFSPCQRMASSVRVEGAYPFRRIKPNLPIAVCLKWDWSGIGVNRALATCL